jgi:hypothetical protein
MTEITPYQLRSEGAVFAFVRRNVFDRHSGSMMMCLATYYLGRHSTDRHRLQFADPRPI